MAGGFLGPTPAPLTSLTHPVNGWRRRPGRFVAAGASSRPWAGRYIRLITFLETARRAPLDPATYRPNSLVGIHVSYIVKIHITHI